MAAVSVVRRFVSLSVRLGTLQHRTAVSTTSGAILPKPKKTAFGLVRIMMVVAPFLYVGTLIMRFELTMAPASHEKETVQMGMEPDQPQINIRQQNETVEKRECLLRALCIYLNEAPSSLFKEYLDSDGCAAQRDLEQVVFGIYSINAEGGDATTTPAD
ncbi:hypothetical protein G5714_004103 [Onychostoma macrolepis]|uniref:Essential MCU regulator, mitochondrial n=1 Tax=Onychostoma macrolepis TaxID=369639 RepID=A0A7J6DCL3_9TELE|nr:hypothetical protein G5714_004103 [Onychostoma macrolepis]